MHTKKGNDKKYLSRTDRKKIPILETGHNQKNNTPLQAQE